MRREWALACCALLGAWFPVAAQDSLVLRYRPTPGLTVRTLSTYTVHLSFRNAAGSAAAPGAVSIEAEVRQSVTDRILAVAGDVEIERTVDSTRVSSRTLVDDSVQLARSEPADPRWRTSARVRLSDRLEVLEVGATGADSLPEVIAVALRTPIGYEFALPEHGVAAGGSWRTTMRFPFQAPPTDGGVPLDTTIVADAEFGLDSIVVRGSDTLAYVAVRGTFRPLTITRAAEGVAGSGTVRGRVTGTLIWSTGWSAFGSGALRSVIEMDFQLRAAEQRASTTLAFDVVNRFEIRP